MGVEKQIVESCLCFFKFRLRLLVLEVCLDFKPSLVLHSISLHRVNIPNRHLVSLRSNTFCLRKEAAPTFVDKLKVLSEPETQVVFDFLVLDGLRIVVPARLVLLNFKVGVGLGREGNQRHI